MRKAALLAAIAMVGLSATRADAQVTFTLDNPVVTGVTPGSTVAFTGTLSNATGVPAYVVDWFANSPFSLAAPGTIALVGSVIAPGASVSATLFSVVVDPSALPGTYSGFFLVDVGREYPPTSRTETFVENFSIGVSTSVSTVPEPATLSLLAGGLGVLAVVGRRRRRAAR